MKKAVCILGATAVGKTSVALNLSKKFNGAIISADSVQLYKNLNIISGKDVNPNLEFVPIEKDNSYQDFNLGYYLIDGIQVYMLDLVDPDREFSIAEFKEIAKTYLNKIFEQEKLPIVVGGSGLYINSVLNPINTLNIRPDYDLRKELQDKSLEEVQSKVKSLNKDFYNTLNNSEKNNKRRLIRKIETLKGESLDVEKKSDIEYLILGLDLPKEKNENLVKKRISYRIKNGALEEAKSLYENYGSLSTQIKNTIGYKDLFSYLKGELNYEQAIESWKKGELRLIKKQKTWFKKDRRIKWFRADRSDVKEALAKEIDSFLKT